VPHNYGDEDEFSDRHGEGASCSYCGSISPDDLFAAIDSGAELGPTDKNYKVYVKTEDRPYGKFYFQHLDADGQRRFISLLNEGKLNIGYPGHFYTLPFFASVRKTPLRVDDSE